MRYRRAYAPGGTFFFTLVTKNRYPFFNDSKNVEIIGQEIRNICTDRPFRMDAIVILPDHIHCLWTLPKGDSDYSTRWRLIKRAVTQKINSVNTANFPISVWQSRYWEHQIRDALDFRSHVEYIHYNPVKHGWVKSVRYWPYSSFHKYVQCGEYDREWGTNGIRFEDDIGKE